MSCKSEDSLPKIMAKFCKSVTQAINRINDALSSDEGDNGNNSDHGQEVLSGVRFRSDPHARARDTLTVVMSSLARCRPVAAVLRTHEIASIIILPPPSLTIVMSLACAMLTVVCAATHEMPASIIKTWDRLPSSVAGAYSLLLRPSAVAVALGSGEEHRIQEDEDSELKRC
ncbi:hypothetical protein BU15DRAFT_63369 [Melanogaster broomeanus]|nr:hypothetical protein BU15DRAFT_63369 [Melanogaster broomeanus]